MTSSSVSRTRSVTHSLPSFSCPPPPLLSPSPSPSPFSLLPLPSLFSPSSSPPPRHFPLFPSLSFLPLPISFYSILPLSHFILIPCMSIRDTFSICHVNSLQVYNGEHVQWHNDLELHVYRLDSKGSRFQWRNTELVSHSPMRGRTTLSDMVYIGSLTVWMCSR